MRTNVDFSSVRFYENGRSVLISVLEMRVCLMCIVCVIKMSFEEEIDLYLFIALYTERRILLQNHLQCRFFFFF